MVNIEKLLKKKGWTGAELGKLSIANFMLNYKKNLENNAPSEDLLISESDFKKIKESSKALSENTQKMLTGVKNQNIQDVVISASNILSAKTDLENVFNVLLIQK